MDQLTVLQLASAVSGFFGTALLFFFSYSLAPFESATWGNEQTAKRNKAIMRKNTRDALIQKVGFGLLCLSFLIQVFAIFK
jgi:hypothetical protein